MDTISDWGDSGELVDRSKSRDVGCCLSLSPGIARNRQESSHSAAGMCRSVLHLSWSRAVSPHRVTAFWLSHERLEETYKKKHGRTRLRAKARLSKKTFPILRWELRCWFDKPFSIFCSCPYFPWQLAWICMAQGRVGSRFFLKPSLAILYRLDLSDISRIWRKVTQALHTDQFLVLLKAMAHARIQTALSTLIAE